MLQDKVRHHTDQTTNHPQSYQMHIALTLPRIQSEGFEHGQRHHHKRGTDDPRGYRFFTTLFHTVYKSSFFSLNSQTIHHFSAIYHIAVLYIPEIWMD